MVGGDNLPTLSPGHQFDSTADLYHMQAQWYDPRTGQFLSLDPLSFAAGDSNLYRYVGNDPVNAVDPDGMEKFPSVFWNGNAWRAVISPTGTSAGDISAADNLLRKASGEFPGAAALDATWHHASFDRSTRTFVMELVDRKAHRAIRHSGGFAQYLDWVAEVVGGGQKKLNALSDETAAAVLRTLKVEDLAKRIRGRLADSAIDFIVKKLQNNGYEVLFAESGEILTEKIVGEKVGRSIIGKVVRTGGKGLPGLFVLLAAGKSYAATGNVGDAALAGTRELVAADLIETGFRLTIVQGSEAIGEYLIDPVGIVRRKFKYLPDEERQEYIRAATKQINLSMKKVLDREKQEMTAFDIFKIIKGGASSASDTIRGIRE